MLATTVIRVSVRSAIASLLARDSELVLEHVEGVEGEVLTGGGGGMAFTRLELGLGLTSLLSFFSSSEASVDDVNIFL